MVLSLANNQALDEFTWATITPGARVAMSIVLRKLLNSTSNPRSSPLDVNLLARTFEQTAGKTQDDWQFDVVAF
jgi:hypothetical protein